MSVLQRNGNEGLRQARPIDKLQALVFHLKLICRLDVEVDDFIHVPTFSFNEVERVLQNGILRHYISMICDLGGESICIVEEFEIKIVLRQKKLLQSFQ